MVVVVIFSLQVAAEVLGALVRVGLVVVVVVAVVVEVAEVAAIVAEVVAEVVVVGLLATVE